MGLGISGIAVQYWHMDIAGPHTFITQLTKSLNSHTDELGQSQWVFCTGCPSGIPGEKLRNLLTIDWPQGSRVVCRD